MRLQLSQKTRHQFLFQILLIAYEPETPKSPLDTSIAHQDNIATEAAVEENVPAEAVIEEVYLQITRRGRNS